MKKTVLATLLALSAGAAMAAANDLLISFSTPGPDKYADGSTVMDGERYALCWSKDFSQFSIASDGAAVGGKVVLSVPLAKDGRCPPVMFEIDAEYAKGFTGGNWAVYLLDTRKFTSEGAELAAGGKTVNTFGLVGDANLGSRTVASLSAAGAASTSVLPDGVELPKPEITAFRVFEGNVYVTVKGTVPYLAYGLTSGDTPDAVTEQVGAPAAGKFGGEDEITLVAPAKEGGAFFKAGRR